MLSPVDFASRASRIRLSNAARISSTAISFSLSSGRGRDYFYLSTVVNLCIAPRAATDDLSINSDGDASRLNVVTDE
jgi:hypothetical protein